MKRLFLLVFASLIAFTTHAKPVIDNNQQMAEAVNSMLSTYEDSGILGVISDVKHCYSDLSSPKLYCFYMDYSARIFDHVMIEVLNDQYGGNLDVNDFFQDETFQERVFTQIYLPSNSSMDEANSHMANLYNLLVNLMNEGD